MSNTSNSKTLSMVALSAAAIGGGVYWYTRKSGSSSDSSSEGIRDKVNNANQEVDTEELKSRFQRTIELARQATVQLQEIYNDYGKDIIEQIQQVKKDSEGVVSTAKEAGDELKDVADTAKKAEQELEGVKDQAKQGAEHAASSGNSGPSSSEGSANQNIQHSPEEEIKRKDNQADIEPQEEGKNQRDPNSKGTN